jgi:hypothetical protein
MVGRSPKHLGRKLGPPEMKIIALYTLLGPSTVLVLTAIAVATPAGRAGLTVNSGPHGFTEIFFAYASALANNGQSMASLNADSLFYNVTTIIAMLGGRFGLAVLSFIQCAARGNGAVCRRVELHSRARGGTDPRAIIHESWPDPAMSMRERHFQDQSTSRQRGHEEPDAQA